MRSRPVIASVIGQTIHQARLDKKLGLKEAALRYCLPTSRLQDWEAGRRLPTTQYLSGLAELTDKTVGGLQEIIDVDRVEREANSRLTRPKIIDDLICSVRNDPQPIVRAAAARALGRMQARDAVAILTEHLLPDYEKSGRVRAACATALGKIFQTTACKVPQKRHKTAKTA